MTHLSKLLFTAAALCAAPVGIASAQDAAPDGDGTTPATGEAAPPAADPAAPAAAGDATGMWPKSIIDRPITLLKGKVGAGADLTILHASVTVGTVTASATSEGLHVGGGYGVSDKLTVGGDYSFALHDFEIKGPLTLYGAFSLTHSDKLTVGASADITLGLGNDPVTETIHAGLGVRYKLAPKFAVFTGNPWTPGVLGQHLSIGLNSGAAKSFAIPVGFAFQATPELFAYASTNIATILLSDPGMGDRVSTIADFTPVNIGAWFNLNKNLDVGGSLVFPDIQHAGDFYGINLGVRYYN